MQNGDRGWLILLVFTSLVSLGFISRRSVYVTVTFLIRISLAAFLAFAIWLPPHNGLKQLHVCNLSAKEYLAIGIYTTGGSMTIHPIIVFIWALKRQKTKFPDGRSQIVEFTPKECEECQELWNRTIQRSIGQFSFKSA